MNEKKIKYTIDTDTKNHMSSNMELLHIPHVCVSEKNVHPNRGIVNVSHTGSCDMLNEQPIRNVL